MKVMEELQVANKEETYARWVKYVNEYEEGAMLYDGFEQVFEAFKTHFKQAIVSAKTKKQYEIDCVFKGIDQYMEAVVLADDTSKHKPDLEPLFECLKRLNVKADEALYVGDALSDYQAAKNAQIDFAYAKWGSVLNQDMEQADFVFKQPIELLSLVKS